MAKELYSLLEAAALIGMNDQVLRRKLKAGEIRAAKMGREWRISRHDLDEYYQRRGGGRLFGDPEGGQ